MILEQTGKGVARIIEERQLTELVGNTSNKLYCLSIGFGIYSRIPEDCKLVCRGKYTYADTAKPVDDQSEGIGLRIVETKRPAPPRPEPIFQAVPAAAVS